MKTPHTPFYREIGQVTDLIVMMCFFALGAYFRQVLHVYVRTPGVSKEEIREKYTERGIFQIFGWGALFFFFLKTITMEGKMGGSWSGLPEFQIPNIFLTLALIIYLVGILGVLFQIYFKREKNELWNVFNTCLAFGSAFPIVWLYPRLHPYLFNNVPTWIVQLSLLFLLLVNSFGILFSFHATLQRKILGNTCLWFVKHGQQVLAFIILWTAVTVYTGINPLLALIFYGVIFVLLAVISNRSEIRVLPILLGIIAISPFLIKVEEVKTKLEARIALVKEIQQKKQVEKS